MSEGVFFGHIRMKSFGFDGDMIVGVKSGTHLGMKKGATASLLNVVLFSGLWRGRSLVRGVRCIVTSLRILPYSDGAGVPFFSTILEGGVARMKSSFFWTVLAGLLVSACAPVEESSSQYSWDMERDDEERITADVECFPDVMPNWSPQDEENSRDQEAGEPLEAEPESSCPSGILCPTTFPFSHAASTSDAPTSSFDQYNCDPEVDESGPEVIYRVEVLEEAFLSAAVYDAQGVDVDVHILSAPDPLACIARGHHDAGLLVKPGVYYVVVDTWSGGGVPLAGEYVVHIGVTIPSRGPCEMDSGIMKRVGDEGDHLVMPATGMVVMEAHLVTDAESAPHPVHPTEELAAHYALSQQDSGFVMNRDQVWAPLEGGSFHGAGIGSPAQFPLAHEAWYVCMYWTSKSRPPKGTPMILRKPGTPLAVVVAAGYETGPGNLANIAGTVEETHFFLGTGHQSTLTLGLASDTQLPLGPRICE